MIIYRYQENIVDYIDPKNQIISFNLPPMLEQIATVDNEIYTLFESTAEKYASDCSAKIESVCVFDIKKIFDIIVRSK